MTAATGPKIRDYHLDSGWYNNLNLPAWLKNTVAAVVIFVVLAAATSILEAVFSIDVRISFGVMLIGALLIVWLYKEKLGLSDLSAEYLRKGARSPMSAYLIVAGIGGLFGVVLFGSSWLYMMHDFKKNPPPLFAPPPPSASSKQPVERTPTAAEIAEEVAKKLPSAPKPKPLPPPPTRIGTGPEAYKDISDELVGQWAIEEADKIEELATRTMNSYKGMSASALSWRFTNDFNDCCSQDLTDLRAEILRRLGPSAKDADEISAWTGLFPETKYPDIARFGRKMDINPMMAKSYAPFLRRLGLRLKRRATPRSAPLALQFSEQQLAPEKPGYSRIVISIETKKELSTGYIAVQFSGLPYSLGTDFEDSKLALSSRPSLDNPLVAKLLETPTTSYVLQIGKTPFVPGRPIHVELRSALPIRVTAVTYFEE